MSAVSVVGLGKLGVCMAAAMAQRGLDVIGVDLNAETIAAVNAGRAPITEPGLNETIAASSKRLRATDDMRDAVLGSEATFIVVPTPSEDDGGFSLRHVAAASERIGQALKQKDAYHLVVLTSTVLPGGTAAGVLNPLEGESGKRCGDDFGLCYSPEFIALGTVLRDFLSPNFVLIGEADDRAGEELTRLYGQILDGDPPIRRMAISNAELAKVALNTFVTTKITFANMLAHMCEALPDGDVDAVTSALGLDERVGSRYFSAGLGYGGPCFPRDNRALRHWADQVGAPALLAHSTDELDRSLGDLAFAKLIRHTPPGATVAFLGLTYKEGSSVLDGSWPLDLATRLAETGDAKVLAYDPLLATFPKDAIDGRLELAGSLREALSRADVVVVANPDPSFAQIQPEDLPADRTVVLDFWRLLRRNLGQAPNVKYVALGLDSPDGAHSRERAEPLRA